MSKYLFVLSSFIICFAADAAIYKWTDRQGTIHYSDAPHLGAKQLNIPLVSSYSLPATQATASEVLVPEKPVVHRLAYTNVVIIQPNNESTIRTNQGKITVKAQVEPDLFPGDKVQIVFDGFPLNKPQSNLLFPLSGIYRGAHTIVVQVVDYTGTVLGTSKPITVYVFRPKVMKRNQA